MHDPDSYICHVRIPIPFMGKHRRSYNGGWIHLFDILHRDPCRDGSDDSCGRFMRSRHGDRAVLEEAVKRVAMEWDSTFQSGTDPDFQTDANGEKREPGPVRFTGMFYPMDSGMGAPNMSCHGIGLNIFYTVLWCHFFREGAHSRTRRKINRYMRKHLWEILHFAENPVDSMRSTICQTFGADFKPEDPETIKKFRREERIHSLVSMAYGCVLRNTRPWWKSPNLHIHHWRINVPILHKLKRFFKRCRACGNFLKLDRGPTSWGDGTYSHGRCSCAQMTPKP